MRRLSLMIIVGIALFACDPAAVQLPQEASPAAAGTRNAIVGHVVDKAGRPVTGVFVTLLQNHIANGLTRVGIARMRLGVRTDAMGSYRLENLDIGPYYVVAIPENPALGADGRLDRAGEGITYFPSVSKLADAREVIVTVRGPAVADITLLPAALAFVSGTVIGQDDKPVAGGMLGVAHGDHMFGEHGRAVRFRPDGSFLLPALPPGTYILEFHEGPWPPPVAPSRWCLAQRSSSTGATSWESGWRRSIAFPQPGGSLSIRNRESCWTRRRFMSAGCLPWTALPGRPAHLRRTPICRSHSRRGRDPISSAR